MSKLFNKRITTKSNQSSKRPRSFMNLDYTKRNKALKEIDDLTQMAESLPETQLRQIFTKTKLEQLLKALLKGEPVEGDQIVENRRTWDLAMALINIAESSAWENIKALRDKGYLTAERKVYERTRTIRTLNRFMGIEY